MKYFEDLCKRYTHTHEGVAKEIERRKLDCSDWMIQLAATDFDENKYAQDDRQGNSIFFILFWVLVAVALTTAFIHKATPY